MAELLVRQLLAGRDFAQRDGAAASMQNFVYLLGDREAGECLVVDPAWDVQGILDVAAAEGLRVVGALVTHYHPDHVGGSIFGLEVEGLPTLMARCPCPVHVHRAEAEGVRVVTGLSKSDLVEHDSGDRVEVGGLSIELLHTPGHTPGSQCFRVKATERESGGALVAGDTLFLQGCGRVDLPGGNVDEMYATLTQRLSSLPGDTMLLPGHAYGGERATMAHVRQTNPTLRIESLERFRARMGG
ncbi:MBL fold metallo-hydrolase [Paraliomyxa miuraensis]|uniref:MBL fold metallo-hydrolase n=1 Tax=Paraliomyxa miuraensis TaxID=376150 RepID=UPI0022532EC9|nr:MBL fold metallo-hydrolase [Paraliomyxa miuraensis]MCX4242817.1 MBL fold metallo-hydrolase [Paraliomyxa miuraensis]